MSRLSAQTQSLIILGCCFALSWLLSFLPPVTALEDSYYQQLLELTPAYRAGEAILLPDFPALQHQLLLAGGYLLIVTNILLMRQPAPSPVLLILLVFFLFMSQLLLALLQQRWLPALWPILSIILSWLLLFIWSRLPHLRQMIKPQTVCNIDDISRHIEQQNYNTAVLLLQHCPFSDQMFDLAYELGLKLEQQENWFLARFLYKWLVQFDPGMQDFVERIELKINPHLANTQLSITGHTDTRNQFAHYQLLGKRARGATATVYEALDMYTQRRIALKVLRRRMDDSTQQKDIIDFLQEAMTVSRLDHPNIVKIHDADIIDDRAFIAMDFIPGNSLAERLLRKRYLTVAECLRVMSAVLNALSTAHQNGIVHGDIKPANIMHDRRAKRYIVTDFGAAYAAQQSLHEQGRRIVGTPAYMSPEQLSGARVDGRSDLFSLAVSIYQLVSGIQPFSGDSLPAIKQSVINDEVDLAPLKLPGCIEQLLDKALQKKTYQRFADADQMLQAVKTCQLQLENNH